MNVHAAPLRQTTEIENLWIPLADGCRLAARMWIPVDAADSPLPAIIEYIPYRKRDHTALRDESMHPQMAARGYAYVRIDIRGNGESEGLMFDEYLPQELSDGVEAIEWIARQPWCTGRVGMVGISWGGFNGLQIAALRPPALKAIITVCSTDDRYADDIHYRGGCLLNDNLGWSATMMAYSSRPPDPLLVGERWREMWLERLRNMPFLAANWLEHQQRDEFWRHGSVCEDFDAIDIPVLAVGGWADAYTNAIPRLLAGLKSPAYGLIGPWGHKYPNAGVPGPAMDFIAEMARWWDHWLAQKSETELPALRAYVLDGPDSGEGDDERQGFWISEPSWPSPNVEGQTLFFTGDGGLAEATGSEGARVARSPQTVGLTGGRYYPKVGRPDLAVDQRPDDAGSIVFDGKPLEKPLVLLGAPAVNLTVSVDRPQANIAVRLSHVAPDGASHRISVGVLNLTHSDDHQSWKPLEPNRTFTTRVALDDIAYKVPAGHRLRVSISTTYWPMIWPSPEPVTLTVEAAGSQLDLLVRKDRGQPAVEIAPTPLPPVGNVEFLRDPVTERRVCRDLATGEVTIESTDDTGLKRLPAHGIEFRSVCRERYAIRRDNPLSAEMSTHWVTETGREGWRVRTESSHAMRSDATTFYLEAELVAFENEKEVFRNQWERAIPRQGV
jgi:uncharacterized protein